MGSLKEVFMDTISNISYKVEEKAPEILVVTGVIGLVAAGVMACKSTIKAKEVIEEAKDDFEKIHDCEANETLKESGEYTEEDAKHDKAIVTIQTGVKLVKLYLIPVAVMCLSAFAVFKSHGMMTERLSSISAAYSALAMGFKKYRKNVVDKFGEDVDKELRYGIKTVKQEEEVTEDGKTKKKKVNRKVVNDADRSDYARFFDSTSRLWEDDAEYNMTFLKQTEAWANKELRSRNGRPLYLNEVYDKLDIERSDAGQHVGWRYLPNDKTYRGDGFVSFGIYDAYKAANRNFVNGLEPVILLDFNVDGEVFEAPYRKSSAHVYGH